MYNPHHNININISYNLQPDKNNKTVPAKRIAKQIKNQKVPDKNADMQIKYNHKTHEGNAGKSQEQKLNNQKKKNKVKKSNNLTRNIQTPDIFNERRIKTQGPFGENEYVSAFKKESKSKNHNKSVQQPIHKVSHSTKRSQSFVKTNKSVKSTQTHIKSCIISHLKKNPIQELEHNYSQTGSNTIKRKRAQSSFIRNDKVVTKLLNVSLLASEIGGSQPVTSQRRHNDSSQSRHFKEYMSSMDMRIIHNMQNDVPIFADKKQNTQRDIIRRIMGSKNISLEQLTKKVIVIQRFLKKRLKEKVVNKYKILFKQITNKMVKSGKFNDISDISLSPQDYQGNSIQNGLSLFQNEGIISADHSLQKKIKSLQSEQFKISMNYIQQVESKDQLLQLTHKNEGLNIKKYRELVNQQVNRKGCNIKNKFKQKYKEEAYQSKYCGYQTLNCWNQKGAIDLQLINEQLIKQSKTNQYWIDNDLDTAQRIHQNNDEDSKQHLWHPLQKQDSLNKEYKKFALLPLNSGHKKVSKSQDSLDEEQQQELYDKNKYELKSEQISKSQLSERDISNGSNIIQPKNELAQVQSLSVQKNKVQKNKQQKQKQPLVVQNYLDCGLDGFGINLDSAIVQIPKTCKQDFKQTQKQQNYLQDQPIGDKFLQSNHFILNKFKKEEVESNDKIAKAKGNHSLLEQVVQNISTFLITQFASDISVILRRSTGPPEKKPSAQRHQGIPTSFNSIKKYLEKFITFIKKQEKYLQKIHQNINKDIGPTSLQILTYLRPQSEESHLPLGLNSQEETLEEQQGLFVIPAQIFQQFQTEIERQNRQQNKKQLNHRMKVFLSFWHRCIFQSFNECLDYERPYGIQGKPYDWISERKKFRPVKRSEILFHLQRAETRLLNLTQIVGGLIFQKIDSPFADADLPQQQKHMMNEQRLSRILGAQLLQGEPSWINYNDELAELLVEMTKIIQQRVFFEYATELKKLQRRRNMVAEQSASYQSVVFNLEQL